MGNLVPLPELLTKLEKLLSLESQVRALKDRAQLANDLELVAQLECDLGVIVNLRREFFTRAWEAVGGR